MEGDKRDMSERLVDARFKFIEARNKHKRISSELGYAHNSLKIAADEYRKAFDVFLDMIKRDGLDKAP